MRTVRTLVIALLFWLPLCVHAEIDTSFSEQVQKAVFAVYYSSKLKDSDRVPLTQNKLEEFANSKSIDERRGAAFVLGEFSTILQPDFVKRLFAQQLSDPDAAVRFIALMECNTCTGYPEVLIRQLKDSIAKARRDPKPEVRELARCLYSYAKKIKSDSEPKR